MPTSVAAWLASAWAALPAVVQAVIISIAISNELPAVLRTKARIEEPRE